MKELFKFLLTGGLNTVIGYIVFGLVYFITSNEYISLIVAYIFGIVFNFKTYYKYVFNNSDKQIFINFIIIYIFMFILNTSILYIGTNVFYINTYIVQFMAICIVVPLLFILNKKFVFITLR